MPVAQLWQAIREALAILVEEGLSQLVHRHLGFALFSKTHQAECECGFVGGERSRHRGQWRANSLEDSAWLHPQRRSATPLP